MSPAPVLSLAMLAVLASTGFAQSVLVVDAAGGPGSSFTSIGAAVAAASDGDFVLVRSGTYPETLTLDGIGLVVQAAAGASVTVRDIRIENLGPTQFAAIRGLDRETFYGQVTLGSNQGSVWLEDSLYVPFGYFDYATAGVTYCDSVVLRGSTFTGGGSSFFAQSTVGIGASNISLYECDVTALPQGGCYEGGSPPGSAGVVVTENSRLSISASSVVGGDGCTPTVYVPFGGPGGPALLVYGLSGPTVVEAIDSSLVGGRYAGSGSLAPAITSYGTLVTVLQPPNGAHRMTAPSPIVSGGTISMTFAGDPGDRVILLVSSTPGPFLTAAQWLGPLVVPRESSRVPLGTLPETGTFSKTIAAPELAPGDLAQSFYLQPLFLGPGEIALGTPTQVHVLDPNL